ncbi:GNAT family N-acetyltransferase [Flavobacterium sp. CAU 1735]|uniref:GNAT family N-acetyltransferase n=1 Tax=Flavobacterium sp. CAU 1735 TaxID=3140361 RepID=UPI00326178D2
MNYLLENQETNRLLFRKLTPSDFENWLPYHHDTEAIEFYNAGKAPEEACKKWFEEQFLRYEQQSGGLLILVDKKSKAIIGQCGLEPDANDTHKVVLRYALLPKFRDKGYAEEALQHCIKTAFDTMKIKSLFAYVSPSDQEREDIFSELGMEWEDTDIVNHTIVNIFKIKK